MSARFLFQWFRAVRSWQIVRAPWHQGLEVEQAISRFVWFAQDGHSKCWSRRFLSEGSFIEVNLLFIKFHTSKIKSTNQHFSFKWPRLYAFVVVKLRIEKVKNALFLIYKTLCRLESSKSTSWKVHFFQPNLLKTWHILYFFSCLDSLHADEKGKTSINAIWLTLYWEKLWRWNCQSINIQCGSI